MQLSSEAAVAHSEVVIAPNQRWVPALCVMAVLVAAAQLVVWPLTVQALDDHNPQAGRILGVAFGMALLLPLFVAMIHYLRTIRLFAAGDQIGRVDSLGRRRSFPRAQVGSVLDIALVGSKRQQSSRWLVVARDGRGLFLVNPAAWSPADRDRWLEAMGLRVTPSERALTLRQFADAYPGVLPGWSRHVPLLTFLLIAAFTTAIVLLLLATGNLA